MDSYCRSAARLVLPRCWVDLILSCSDSRTCLVRSLRLALVSQSALVTRSLCSDSRIRSSWSFGLGLGVLDARFRQKSARSVSRRRSRAFFFSVSLLFSPPPQMRQDRTSSLLTLTGTDSGAIRALYSLLGRVGVSSISSRRHDHGRLFLLLLPFDCWC